MSNESVMNAFAKDNASPGGTKVIIPKLGGDVYYAEPGEYPATVSKMYQKESGAGNPMFVFDFIVDVSGGNRLKARLHCPIVPSVMWKLTNVCNALGIEEGEIDLDDVKGRSCMVTIIDGDEWEGNNGQMNKSSEISGCKPMPTDAPAPKSQAFPVGPEDDDVPF